MSNEEAEKMEQAELEQENIRLQRKVYELTLQMAELGHLVRMYRDEAVEVQFS